MVQRAGFDPGSLPPPAQRLQRSMRSTSISRSVPKAASSKEISTFAAVLAALRLAAAAGGGAPEERLEDVADAA